ncbi:MAG: RdgB/HAM1 family non-canonical purine NTP pyrophosphatase [Chloroflexota bacterium]
MTHRLVIGTNNPGKLREFRELLDGCGFELVTPRELGVNFDPEETGGTYAENATMKAVEAARACGLPALADDSGLEVDHLGGRPGIYSARYAGGDRTDPNISEARQLELLLEEMKGVPDEQRTARFRCAIAIATPTDEVQLVDGVFEGRIGHEVRGTHGFGYDPIFVLPERGVTSAELPPEEKNRISHRGQAAAKARELLRKMSGDATGA